MRILFLLLISFSAFSQTQISGSRIRDNSIPPEKFTDAVGRPVSAGALTAPYELTFDEVQKSYTLSVTEDIALTVAGSGNVANSRIYITAQGDGSHTLTYPSDWKLKGTGVFNPTTTNEIEINYRGSYTTIEIITLDPVIIPVLNNAVMAEGTDDLTLTFDFPVTITTAGWSITASGGAATVSSVVSGSGTTTIVFDLSRNITSGEEMSISYNPATGNTVSSTGNEIAAITNFFVDTGDESLPSNVITVGPGQDYATCQECAAVATNGQICQIKGGTYRETITPANNGVTFQPFPGETVIIDGRNVVGTSWTVHSGNIYKTTITLPVDNSAGYNLSINNSNTTLFNNQIFKDNTMQFEARYPNITTEADLLDFSKMRHTSQITSFGATSLVDTSIPTTGLTGAKLMIHGWFWNRARTVTSQPSQSTLNYTSAGGSDARYRKYYYVCGKLGLLDAAKEWYYDDATNTLYLWQTGGGSPTNISYKARNWGFDLRGRDNIIIKGLTFIGCEVATGDPNTDGCTIDNVRATYTNHDVMYEDLFPGYGNATETGIKLLGGNNTVKNSEFRYTAAHGIWVGSSGIIQNNLYEDCAYDGSWGAPFSFAGYNTSLGTASWGNASNVKILYNTVDRTGRSCVDMSPSYTGNTKEQNLNIEIGYNDFSGWGMINIDLGAIYAWGWRNLTGSTYHHNWFHDDGVKVDPAGVKLDGGQRAVYFDQGSGGVTVRQNVFWNLYDFNSPSSSQDTQDIYSQMEYTGASGFYGTNGGINIYNNTIVSALTHHSYATYEDNTVRDRFRNNLIKKILNLDWTGGQAGGYMPDEQYNLFDGEITNSSSASPGTGSAKNQDFETSMFLETGADGLYYRLHASSPARNTGTAITGVTPDGDSSPDIGAYQYGEDWVPGYSAATLDDEVYIQNDNLVFTSYSATPSITTNAVYNGGSASFFGVPAVGQTVTVTFTGTGLELFAEEYNHAGIISVTVDGVQRDCDTGTGGTQNCDLYVNSTTNNSTSIITVTGLSAGQHTAVFEVEDKNASSSNYYFVYDAIRVIE